MEEIKNKGVFVYDEFIYMDKINVIDRFVLSVYKYFTEEGSLKCCKMTTKGIAERLNLSEQIVYRSRKKLKKLGLIKTDGGNTTWYIGMMEPSKMKGGPIKNEGGDPSKMMIDTIKNDGSDTIKNDAHNNTLNKFNNISSQDLITPIADSTLTSTRKECEETKTTFDKIIDLLPSEYKKDKYIEFLQENFSKEIESMNSRTDLDDYQLNCNCRLIRHEIDKVYDIETGELRKKEKPKKIIPAPFMENMSPEEKQMIEQEQENLKHRETSNKDETWMDDILG